MTTVVRGYKVELDLNNQQRAACLKHAGAARYAYNWRLTRYEHEAAAGRKTPNETSHACSASGSDTWGIGRFRASNETSATVMCWHSCWIDWM